MRQVIEIINDKGNTLLRNGGAMSERGGGREKRKCKNVNLALTWFK